MQRVLIDDDLRAVHEVTELRFPHHERRGIGDGVAVLEAHARVLREQRVVDEEPSAVRVFELAQRCELGPVL